MKMKDRLMIFREEDAGGAGGDDVSTKGAAVFEEGGAQKKEEVKQEDAPPPSTVDAKALAEQLGATLKEAFGDRKEAPKEITAEEARKLLKFPEIDDEFMKKFGDIATTKAALEDFRDKLLTHIHTVNGMTRREMMDEMDGKFKPALEYVTKAEQRERDSDFDKAYPVLAKQELKPIITAVRESLKNEKFSDEKAHFKAVADGVAAVIKVHNPDFKLTDGSSPSKTKTSSSGGIATTTPGSGGGGGGGENKDADKPKGIKVFDK